jgi:thiol peroxidase
MNEVELSDFLGKPLIISVVPSLDTSVCNAQTRRFEREAQMLGDNVTILTISNDLPYAQRRFKEKERIQGIKILSDYRYRKFGLSLGLLIKETCLLARSVIVVSTEGLVRYVQIVPDQGQQPDYEPVLEAVRDMLVAA